MTTTTAHPRQSAPPIGDVRLLVHGHRTDAVGGATCATTDPATGAALARVVEALAEDVDRAERETAGIRVRS